jgi:hypothetical protein
VAAARYDCRASPLTLREALRLVCARMADLAKRIEAGTAGLAAAWRPLHEGIVWARIIEAAILIMLAGIRRR